MAVFSRKSEKSTDTTADIPSERQGSSESSPSVVGQGNIIRGNLNCQSDIRIDGTLYGDIRTQGKLIIGAKGRIEGNVLCQEAIIQGSLEGSIQVLGLLEVQESARMSGEISTAKLKVNSGAIFNVVCDMSGKKIKSFGVEPSDNELVAVVNE